MMRTLAVIQARYGTQRGFTVVNRVCPFRAIYAISLILVLTVSVVCAQLRDTRQLTSNNIIALAGSGDTLWLATERGFNYRTSVNTHGTQDGWPGFEANDLSHRLWGLAFGNGSAAAIVNNSNRNSLDYIGFWHFDHVRGRQQERYFRFSNAVRGENGNLANPVGSAVYIHGNFWAPFNNGGMVRYEPNSNSVHTIRPGDASEVSPPDLAPENLGNNNGNARSVLSLDINYSDSSILVTTPTALWLYSPANGKWDTLHINPVFVSSEEFISFSAAFAVNKRNAFISIPAPIQSDTASTTISVLYSFITVKRGNDSHTALYSYNADSNQWFRAHDASERFSIFPAVDGGMYALFDDNRAVLFADTAEVIGGRMNHLSEILSRANFREMLTRAGDDPNPLINDILFLPRSDSSGTLVVATGTGLYISETVNLLSANHNDYNFTHIRYVRGVKRGEAYALPGIIRSEMDGRYDRCVFVYRLQRDGNVTIRVYDYNMSLVKTVVKNEHRSAALERSTNPARDVWDGTNEIGRAVWPGVYYFKITSSGKERFTGRVIIAK